MVLFLDRTFGGKKLAPILRAAGLTVEVLIEHFHPDSPDTEWIPAVAARGWVILTQDKNIRNRTRERDAVRTSGARLFMLTNNNRNAEVVGELLIRVMPKVILQADLPGPFIAQIQFSGDVRVLDQFEDDNEGA